MFFFSIKRRAHVISIIIFRVFRAMLKPQAQSGSLVVDPVVLSRRRLTLAGGLFTGDNIQGLHISNIVVGRYHLKILDRGVAVQQGGTLSPSRSGEGKLISLFSVGILLELDLTRLLNKVTNVAAACSEEISAPVTRDTIAATSIASLNRLRSSKSSDS